MWKQYKGTIVPGVNLLSGYIYRPGKFLHSPSHHGARFGTLVWTGPARARGSCGAFVRTGERGSLTFASQALDDDKNS